MLGRRRKRTVAHSVIKDFDWSVDPETVREVLAVAIVAASVVSLLALFGAAGQLGARVNQLLSDLFGITRYFLPVIGAFIGACLWNPKQFPLRPAAVGGALLFLFGVAGLMTPLGGTVGRSITVAVEQLLGDFAGRLVLFALVIASVPLILNTPLKAVLALLPTMKLPESTSGSAPVADEAKVSVFEAVKQRLKQAGTPAASAPVETAPAHSTPVGDWEFPPLDLLQYPTGKASPGNVVKNVETIEKTLKDFGVTVSMGDVNIGPTVTQYTFKPAEGVKLTKITARQNDLALSLAAPSIRMEAPIPGKSAVGIEVPNKVPAVVTLREVLETDECKAVKSSLTIALGRDAAGTPMAVDLKKMPHLLIAGSTGSGKSIAINALIVGLLYQNTPAELRMLMVDPKRVEFTPFNDIPHLLAPVITEPDKTVNTLKWALLEMERRFKMFQEVGSRDIESYNAKHKAEPLPYIVIIIDELADLMATSAKEVEGAIVRLAQMARAVGMHLVVATQRPSVDVITGLIKANISTRIAFAVASQVDSRTIIDLAGAEKLLGNGDMLLVSSAHSNRPKRIQGCLITEREIKAVTDFLKSRAPTQYSDEVMNFAPRGLGGGAGGGDGEIDDDMYNEAKQVVITAGKGSASLLQRRLRVGYARAARLLDLLEEQGVIGPADGAKPRDVLVGMGGDYSPASFVDDRRPPSDSPPSSF